MPNRIVIEVGGDTPKIKLTMAQTGAGANPVRILKIICSKCFAEFARRLVSGPEPKLADATSCISPEFPKGLCIHEMDANTPGAAQQFDAEAYKIILAHKRGDRVTVPAHLESGVKPPVTSVSISARVAALEARIAAKPGVSNVEIEQDDNGDITQSFEYNTTGWSDNQRKFANYLIAGMSPEQAISLLPYKTDSARKGALTRFKKVPAIVNLMAQMEATE